MATNYTSLLGFALPVTGELSGTWGDTVNNSITQLEEDAIAGTATASVTGGNWTLSTTGSGAANEARKAVLIPTGTPGVSRNIVAPSQSKAYIVDNQSDADVVVKGAATSGVTLKTGETALVAWDGADFIKVGNFGGDGVFVDLSVTGTATIAIADINGGTVDGTTIGGTTAAAGSFTTLNASGATVVDVNSSSTALRITQTGSGNALVVEDSTNPDSTPVVIDNSGRTIIGYTALLSTGVGTPSLHTIGASASAAMSASTIFSNDTGGSSYVLGKSRGAIGSVGTPVLSGDTVGIIYFVADDGTALIRAAQITGAVDGTPGTNDMPGRLVFSTTADGASSPTERMRIDNQGRVGIGSTALANAMVRSSANLTGATTMRGIHQSGVVQSDVTTAAYQFTTTNSGVADTAFTLPIFTHYYADQGTFGASATITNQYGFFVTSSLTGATNNYAFYTNVAAGTGRWNFYANGTANNYFAGSVGIGSNSFSGYSLLVSKTLTGTVSPTGIGSQGQVQSDATTSATYFRTSATTEAAAFTLPTLRHYYANQSTIGAGSTVTNQFGFLAESTLTGATNNYGFYSGIASGTGRWNFYAAGTADNYFGGPTTISVNSTSDALRITQTGSGNALVVEDAANPDSTPFVIDASGNVVVGSSTSVPQLAFTPQLQVHSTGVAGINVTRWVNSTAEPNILISKSRGASVGTYASVQSGDGLGILSWTGDDGTAFIQAASIRAAVDGTPGTNDMPGRLVFSTTADGASSPTERYRINSAGTHFFGNTTTNTNSTMMVVNGEISETTGGTQYKLVNQSDIGTAPNEVPLNGYLGGMAFQSPEGVVISGGTGALTTLSVSSSVTLSGGTANGVLYLDGSKVATSGSALTFDGTNLGVGTSSPDYKLDVSATGTTVSSAFRSDQSQMWVMLKDSGTTLGNVRIGSEAGSFIAYANGNQLTLNSSGNLGLGVTPSAWASGTFKVLQMFGGGAVAASSAQVNFSHNWVSESGGDKYIATAAASVYSQSSGEHRWYTAPSGTAGNAITFTQAMTLDASGRLGVGVTSPSIAQVEVTPYNSSTGGLVINKTYDFHATNWALKIQGDSGTSGGYAGQFANSGGWFITQGYSYYGGGPGYITDANSTITSGITLNSGVIAFYTDSGLSVSTAFNHTERARFDNSGNFLVGKTSTADTVVGFGVGSAGSFSSTMSQSTDGTVTAAVYSTGAGNYRFYVGMGGTVYATNTTISAISDQRLKENIQDIDVGLNAVMALKPRKFDWKEGKGKDKKGDRGWIAQEFEQVFPDLIDTWKDPAPEGEEPYKSVRADLIPVLVKAIQEQQAIIEQLKARLDAANL